MKKFRTFVAQSPAILISLVALFFSLGGGVAYAASSPHSRSGDAQGVQAIRWSDLQLNEGLTGNVDAGGTPEFGVNGTGIVYLRGTINIQRICANRDEPDIATLPPGNHPAHVLYFPVVSPDGVEGGYVTTAFVAPNGEIGLFKPFVCTPGISLDSISFALG